MGIGLAYYDVVDKMPKPGSARDPLQKYRSKIPVGKCGLWSVERFTVEKSFELLRAMRDGRGMPPGEYTRLCRSGQVVMSDTNAEINDLQRLFQMARGRVLINGLGLGVALQGVLLKPEVTSVDVVEKSGDVLMLVGPHFQSDHRVTMYHEDCLMKKWPRGTRWDVAWHDIWDNICGDNLPQMNELQKRFARRVKWQHCWARELIRC